MFKYKLSLSFLAAFFVLALAGNYAWAQEVAFRVIGVKGEAKAGGNVLKVGSQIKAGETIELAEGGYLGLAHSKGKTTEIKKGGSYKVAELEAALGTAGNSGIASKYADLIMGELTAGNDASRYKTSGKTGSVHRAPVPSPLMVMMPENSTSTNEVYASKVTIKWYPKEDNVPADATYKVIFKNMFDEVVYEMETNDQHLTVDLADAKFAATKAVKYVVQLKSNPSIASASGNLKKLSADKAAAIDTDVKDLMADNSAISKLILARYFEDKGLIGNAITAYEEALKISSTDQYQEMYRAFLDRNYLSKKSREENQPK